MQRKLVSLMIWISLLGAASANAQTTIRVNAGGPAYTDSKGQAWSADFGFNSGNPSGCAPKATVTGTPDPFLFKSARVSGTANPELQYTFAMTNGSYAINLYFADPCDSVVGNRVFDVQLQGKTVFSRLDIVKVAGLKHALIESATVSVTNGQLTIRFVHHNDNPILEAIEIVPSTAATMPAISSQPSSTTVNNGQTATFSVSATGTAPLTYQWQRGGAAISGATSSAYTTAATSSADNGSQFRALVSNSKGTATSNTATLTVSPTVIAPTITSQPASQTVTAGQTATFSVTASGTSPLNYRWQKNGSIINGAISSTYTTPVTASTDNGARFAVEVSNAADSVTSNDATLSITAQSAAVDVITYHNDNGRTGQNLKETTLTLANVNQSTFGLRKIVTLDGKVDAQPLFLSGVSIAGGTHDVVYVVTEHDSVYALDSGTGAVLWHVSTLTNGETTSDTHGCGQVSPEIGITSTPVIDRTRGPNGAIYVVAMSKNSNGSYFQRLYAFDVTSGAQLFGGPHTITASYPGSGDHSSAATSLSIRVNTKSAPVC